MLLGAELFAPAIKAEWPRPTRLDQQLCFANESGSQLFTVTAVPYSLLDLTFDSEGAPAGGSDEPDHLEIVDFTRTDFFKV